MKGERTRELAGNTVWSRLALAIASGVMLGASFPPSPTYSVAYVALDSLASLA